MNEYSFTIAGDTEASPTNSALHILVFKTNIPSKKDAKKLELALQRLKGVCRWNLDLLDIDKVLRIVTRDLKAQEIIDLVTKCGYFCEELPD
ncbi:hypothetical protein GXP67_00335 [Rhodocytophaga rosea]|uniref:Heavy-metal-associated domain-containing protein n=1 Tax=Rhodocytophaga rosea TaxID=2704465 RepID=A0A6C0GB92_9BACT|nr:hypothetical protein [Rhodocytophaga rosea]QHT65229.1 hypothetical protein GXP67_00335 [Rhodocytophaga rosea]